MSKISKKIFSWFFRIEFIIAVIAIVLPACWLLSLAVVKILEDSEVRNYTIVVFVSAAILTMLRWLFARRRTKVPASGALDLPVEEVESNPDWSDSENELFAKSKSMIRQNTAELQSWNMESFSDELPTQALNVIRFVAENSPGGQKDQLDFTIPELLLLIEQVSRRYRGYLCGIPGSSIFMASNIRWVLKRKQDIYDVAITFDWLIRGASFIRNPVGSIIKEGTNFAVGSNFSFFSEQSQISLQRVLLEEVARASIDLYSGRLKISDEELQRVKADEERYAKPVEPVRIIVVGQASAGKSSLVNLLSKLTVAETDAAPSTTKSTTHMIKIGGTICKLVDTEGFAAAPSLAFARARRLRRSGKEPGFDGISERIAEECGNCDLIILVVRADSAARAPDAEFLKRLDVWFASKLNRKKPKILAVASRVDQIPGSPPWPAYGGAPSFHKEILQAAEAISSDLESVHQTIPAKTLPPGWNIDLVREWVEKQIPNAIQVQLNRRRVKEIEKTSIITETAGQARRGAKMIFARLTKW